VQQIHDLSAVFCDAYLKVLFVFSATYLRVLIYSFWKWINKQGKWHIKPQASAGHEAICNVSNNAADVRYEQQMFMTYDSELNKELWNEPDSLSHEFSVILETLLQETNNPNSHFNF
jgi:hypothetical protein